MDKQELEALADAMLADHRAATPGTGAEAPPAARPVAPQPPAAATPDDVEAWADALLDAHRSAPPAAWDSPRAARRALRELPLAYRTAYRHSGRMPDPDEVERIQRRARSHRVLENVQGIATIALVTLLMAFAIVFLDNF